MTKAEFVDALREKLRGLPKQEIDERISFYSEMIDDLREDGRTEIEAVSEIGSVEDISAQILADIPLTKIVKERIKPKRRLKTLEIALLAIGSPVWLSLAISAFAVILSLYIVLWSLVVSVWAIFASFAGCSLGCVAVSGIYALEGNLLIGLAAIGAAIVCAGLAIFTFFGSKAATRAIIHLTRMLALKTKKSFVRKEDAE